MGKKPTETLVKAVAATAELCGRTFSEAAARMFVTDLADFPEPAVLAALHRCRLEVRGALTLSDVVSRIDDGRPGPEEAWAMLPRDEMQTVVMTDEIADAWGLVRSMIENGEQIPARLAFKERYTLLLTRARTEKRPVHWFASLGDDKAGREAPLRDAVEKGRLSATHVAGMLPPKEAAALLEDATARAPMPQHIRELLKLPARKT